MTTRGGPVNWRREAIFPAQALADSILLAPWLLLLLSTRHIPPERAVSAGLLIILGALYLRRAMQALKLHAVIQRLIVLAGWMTLVVGALNWAVFSTPRWAGWAWLGRPLENAPGLIRLAPEAVIVSLSLIWLIWCGLGMAEKPISAVETTRSFQMGVIALTLLVVVNTGRDITYAIPAYFFAQLLAIGLSRIEGMANERSGRRSPFNAWWLSMLVGATGLVIILGSVASIVVLGIGPERLIGWLWPVLRIIVLPVVIILAPFITLLGLAAEAMFRSLFARLDRLTTLFTSPLANLPQSNEPAALNPTLQRAFEYGGVLLTLLSVAAIVVAAIWAATRRREQAAGGDDEQHESMWSSRALLDKLRAQLWNRLARLKQLADMAGRLGAGGVLAALTIRRIYAQTVKLAASRGYPRPAARTPYEHLVTLQLAFPGCDLDLADITEAYVGVHYGELPERPDALDTIRAAWERIKAASAQHDKEPHAPQDRDSLTGENQP